MSNKSLLLGLCIGLFLSTGCATVGIPDYDVDPRALDKAQHTVDNWLESDRKPARRQECRTFEWTNIYGQTELKTECE